MFKITLVSVILASIVSGVSLASGVQNVRVDQDLDYVVPEGSPVKFTVVKGQLPIAYFKGRFVMSGTYHYGYDEGNGGRQDTYLDLYFLPDRKISVLLPYWKREGHVNELRFKNEEYFIKIVIPQSKIYDLKRKKIFSVSGTISIVVDNYQASVECDYPTYMVTFVSIYKPAEHQTSHGFVTQYGC